jgi:hypothetical protein
VERQLCITVPQEHEAKRKLDKHPVSPQKSTLPGVMIERLPPAKSLAGWG